MGDTRTVASRGTGFVIIGQDRTGTAATKLAVAEAPEIPTYNSKFTGRQRQWSEINSVVLHCTGFNKKNTPTAEWKTQVKAHFGVRLSGAIVQLTPDLRTELKHANNLSVNSIAIELEGNFAGLLTDPKQGGGPYFWTNKGENKSPDNPTQQQITATRNLLTQLFVTLMSNGTRLKYIFAHRQSDDSRQSDPGQIVWQQIALWFQNTLSIQRTAEYVTNDGSPIPQEWDPKATTQFWYNNKSFPSKYAKSRAALG